MQIPKSPEEMQDEFENAMQSGLYSWGQALFEVATRRPNPPQEEKEENEIPE